MNRVEDLYEGKGELPDMSQFVEQDEVTRTNYNDVAGLVRDLIRAGKAYKDETAKLRALLREARLYVAGEDDTKSYSEDAALLARIDEALG